MSKARRAGAAVALAVALSMSGCDGGDVSSDPSGGTTGGAVGPLVAEDVVRLDLRDAPTAEEAGIGPDRPDLILSRVGEAIDTQIELPGGQLSLDAFGVNIGAPIGEPAPTYAGEIVINVRSGDTAEVEQMLLEQAPVLGIDPAQVRQWAERSRTPKPYDKVFFEAPASSTGPTISVEVRRDETEDNWTLNYSFSFSAPPGAGA